MPKEKKKVVSAAGAPSAIGPYSQAVAAGGLLFCSGQIPLHPGSGGVMPGGVAKQTRRVLENLKAIIEETGSKLENVVKTTVYLKNLDDFDEMNEVYAEFFPADPPARATVEVSRLPRNVLVEVECVALVS